jgi:hypothetical protein
VDREGVAVHRVRWLRKDAQDLARTTSRRKASRKVSVLDPRDLDVKKVRTSFQTWADIRDPVRLVVACLLPKEDRPETVPMQRDPIVIGERTLMVYERNFVF